MTSAKSSLLASAEGRQIMRDHRIAEDALVAFRRALAEAAGGDSIVSTLSVNGEATALPVPLSRAEAEACCDVWQQAHRRQYAADVRRIMSNMERTT